MHSSLTYLVKVQPVFIFLVGGFCLSYLPIKHTHAAGKPPSIQCYIKKKGKRKIKISESAKSLKLTFLLSKKTKKTVSIEIGFAGSAKLGSDFEPKRKFVHIPPGQIKASFIIDLRDNSTIDPKRKIQVSAKNPKHALAGYASKCTITIQDNDKEGLVFSKRKIALIEGESNQYTLRLSAKPQKKVLVQIDAGVGVHSIVVQSKGFKVKNQLTFTPDNWNIVQIVSVHSMDDEKLDTCNRTIQIVHIVKSEDRAFKKLMKKKPESITVSVKDNDLPMLKCGRASVLEPDNLEPDLRVFISVYLEGKVCRDALVHYATVWGSAQSPRDFKAVEGILKFKRLKKKAQAQINLAVAGDDDVEGDERFFVKFSHPTNLILEKEKCPVLIFDNDVTDVFFKKKKSVIREGFKKPLRIGLALSNTSHKKVEVSVETDQASTAGKKDFELLFKNPVTFPAGIQSAQITLRLREDFNFEGTEKIVLKLKKEINARVGYKTDTHIIEIVDNDRLSVAFEKGDSKIKEGKVTHTVKLKLIGKTELPVIVKLKQLQTSNSAEEKTDFIIAAKEVIFKAGQKERAVSVEILDDDIYESFEYIALKIDKAILENGSLLTPSKENYHNITIEDDEKLSVSFAENESFVNEKQSSHRMVLQLSGKSSRKIIVKLKDVTKEKKGGATFKEDYDLASSEVIFTVKKNKLTAVEESATVKIIFDQQKKLSKAIWLMIESAKDENGHPIIVGKNKYHKIQLLD